MDVTINHDDLQLLIRLAGMGVDTMQGTQSLTDLQCEQYERIAVAHRLPAGLPPKAQARLSGTAEFLTASQEQHAADLAARQATEDAADRQRLERDRERLVARLKRDDIAVEVPPVMMPLKGVQAAINSVLSSHDRTATTKLIKTFLKARTGRTWSVTGSTGTAYGWLHIKAPAARVTDYQTTMDDQVMLALALGLERPTRDFSVAASTGHWQAALERAAGLEVTGSEAAYWD